MDAFWCFVVVAVVVVVVVVFVTEEGFGGIEIWKKASLNQTGLDGCSSPPQLSQ